MPLEESAGVSAGASALAVAASEPTVQIGSPLPPSSVLLAAITGSHSSCCVSSMTSGLIGLEKNKLWSPIFIVIVINAVLGAVIFI